MRFMFKLDYRLPVLPLAVLMVGVGVLAIGVGLLNSRDVLRRQPLAVLREVAE